jgi:putative nucleotidyltransferase with HDIG domain
MLGSSCSGVSSGHTVATNKGNIRSLLLTFEALSELGSEMTAPREFSETARVILQTLMQAVSAREGALFTFTPRPAMLRALAVNGFPHIPISRSTGLPITTEGLAIFIPLFPKHVHAMANMREPQPVTARNCADYLTANGNLSPELFKMIAPLRVAGRLVGMIGLGRREEDAAYSQDDIQAIGLLSHYIALAVNNYELTQSLEQRITEHLRLLGSTQQFYDNTLAAFGSAIDMNQLNVRGHSERVARYAFSIGEAMGLDPTETAAAKAGGYLHDIGMVAVNKTIFDKPARLDENEFREMADHTIIGHRIVSSVEFPWPRIPEIVRGHHERADGSGYPDHLHVDETAMPARIVAVADTFDALVNDRTYRKAMPVGSALSELVRLTPQKFDPAPVHELLVQIRRDTVGSNKTPFLDEQVLCNLGAHDIDNLTSLLIHKLNAGRTYFA